MPAPAPKPESLLGPDVPPPLRTREFDDIPALRTAVESNVFDAVRNMPEQQIGRYALGVRDVRWTGPTGFTPKQHKDAVLSGGTLARQIQGVWSLRDRETGREVANKKTLLARVPWLTPLGTFVFRGNDYTVGNQLRLLPGAYTRKKKNGETETHVNVLPGQGISHRYFLDPASGQLHVRIRQAKTPLMPMLRALGASDQEIRETLGEKLYAANRKLDTPQNLKTLYNRLVRRPDPAAGPEIQARQILEEANRMKLDPDVSRVTLGEPFDRVDSKSVLRSVKRLLAVHEGLEDVDDRDHPAFQRLMGPEDLFSERITNDYGRVRQTVLRRAALTGTLDHVPPGVLTRQLDAVMLNSGLASPGEEINSLEILDKIGKVSRMGEGGLPDTSAVPDEARAVNPAHLGIIDGVRTPECASEDTEVMTETGWKPWPEVTESDKLACMVDGRLEFHRPIRLIDEFYEGPLYCARTAFIDYRMTPNHRMWIRKGFDRPQWQFETAQAMHPVKADRLVQCGGHDPFEGRDEERDWLPAIEKTANNMVTYRVTDAGDWAEFLGWYLSEGSTVWHPESPAQYRVDISQSREKSPENYAAIGQLLSRLPFAYSGNKVGWHIGNKQLADYCRQFGDSYTVFIPEEMFSTSVETRMRLFQSLLAGDGRSAAKGARKGERTQFCTSSKRLSDGFVRLAFGLGYSVRTVFEPESRPQFAHCPGCWVTHIHARNIRVIRDCHPVTKIPYRYVEDYSGRVYCAEVPGGLLYTRRGNSVGFWSGNSLRAGVDVYAARGARKGSDGKMYFNVRNIGTGETELKSPGDLMDAVIVFPGERSAETKGTDWVRALAKGRMRYVRASQATHEPIDFEDTFSHLGNMIPFKSASKPQRMSMGARMITQALPLKNPETPLVRSASSLAGGKSFETLYAKHAGAVHAAQDGVVVSATPGEYMKVRYQDGTTAEYPLYSAFPYNRKSGLDMTPRFTAGQKFRAGAPLVTSNFTDANGDIAMGLNLRTAYMPFKGLNYEDAIVVSESAAKRLSSEHMYQHRHDNEPDLVTGRGKFLGLFPKKFEKRQLDQLDQDGVVLPGTEVRPGDPLILAAKKMLEPSGRLHAKSRATWTPAPTTWDHHQPGVVTDVVRDRKGVSVVVRSHNELQVADKLSGRVGDKGVVAAIIPDDQMPRDQQGRPIEVVMNELGVISRANATQVAEAILGKVAADKLGGKPYDIQDFRDIDDVVDWARRQAEEHGVPVEENLEDPMTGARIPNVLTGNRFVMKLSHTAESKGQARGLGAYSQDESPAKGGFEGGQSKRVSLLNVHALLSAGATGVLRDAALVRGQKNPEYWLAFQQGRTPADPDVPLIHQKMINEMKAGGINVVPEGNQLHIMALLDRDVDELAGDREVTNRESGRMVNDEFTPTPGGLFDPKLVGPDGNKWAKITFSEPIPNPVMEEPIRRMLGLTQEGLEQVISGEKKLENGETGPAGLKKALDSINVPRELMLTRAALKTAKSSKRDALIRKLGYLKAAERLDIHPRDWMLSRAPVLPARFRPISVMDQSGLPLVSDANWLYRELLEARDNLKTMSEKSSDVGEERLALYQAMKAVTGLGDPLHPKLREKGISGVLKSVFGSNPKQSVVQQKLIGSTVDLVGRGVVTPDPDLDMDSIGIPESKAWDIYRMHVVRGLKRRGMPLGQALEETEKKSARARDELLKAVEAGPIMMDRAPVLHRFGEMAFWPRLTKDEAVHVSPLVIQGFGMDFDGDAVQYHVPGTEDAARDMIDRLMPSRNLISPADFKRPLHVPIREYALGLYLATRPPENSAQAEYFEDEAAAIRAFRRGEIRHDQPVEILGKGKK